MPTPVGALADVPVKRAFQEDALEPIAPELMRAVPPEPPPVVSQKRIRSGVTGTLVGGGLFFTASTLTWVVAERSGRLGNESVRGRDSEFATIAMAWGGVGTFGGGLAMGLAAQQFGKAFSEDRPRLGHAMLGSGAAVTALGAGALFTTAVFIPSIERACPIGMGCTLAGLQGAALVTSVGVAMMSFGGELRPKPPRRMDRKLRKAWITGTMLSALGYLGGVAGGMLTWQQDPDSDARRRARNGMFVPVVGPWVVAGSPDVPLFFAGFAALSGGLQLAGAITLGVSAGITAKKRRADRGPLVHDVVVAPTHNGLSISGRF